MILILSLLGYKTQAVKITNFDYIDIEKEISDRTEEFYRRVNHEWIGLFNDTTYNYHPLYKICPFKDNNDMNYYVKVFEEEESKSSNKRVGIVNMKVSSQQSLF